MCSLKSWSFALVLAVLCASARPAPPREPPDGPRKPVQEKLEKAASNGDPEAQYQLSVLTQQSDRSSKGQLAALSWLRKAARQGHMFAQYELGRAYFKSDGEQRNLPLAANRTTMTVAQVRFGLAACSPP